MLLDQVPFEDIALLQWRTKIGYVSQDHPIFSGTILSNVVGGSDFDELEDGELTPVWEASHTGVSSPSSSSSKSLPPTTLDKIVPENIG